MNDIDELRRIFKPLSSESVSDETRSKINVMIDQYQVVSKRLKTFGAREILHTGGAAIAAIVVFCFVVLRIDTSSSRLAEGSSPTMQITQSHLTDWLPYIVLLGTSVIVSLFAWILRRGIDALAYRYAAVRWLSVKRIGIRLYDSVSFQTFIAILFSWIMFGVFATPSSVNLWLGVATLFIFFTICGSIPYLLFSVIVIFLTAIPAWWVATEPPGNLVNWYLMIIFNVTSFLVIPGVIFIPVRNIILQRLRKSWRGEML